MRRSRCSRSCSAPSTATTRGLTGSWAGDATTRSSSTGTCGRPARWGPAARPAHLRALRRRLDLGPVRGGDARGHGLHERRAQDGVTSSAQVTPWEGTRVTDGTDLHADVARLRTEATGDVAIFGSSGLTVTLLEQGLVDELRIL
ncbi:MAG: hypothetical protein GEV07_27240, partial [Streptosporangiales bacterium]|nr:hypothetical protein [Streptosporangiales bacterium]